VKTGENNSGSVTGPRKLKRLAQMPPIFFGHGPTHLLYQSFSVHAGDDAHSILNRFKMNSEFKVVCCNRGENARKIPEHNGKKVQPEGSQIEPHGQGGYTNFGEKH
jgi:hypothetical protein